MYFFSMILICFLFTVKLHTSSCSKSYTRECCFWCLCCSRNEDCTYGIPDEKQRVKFHCIKQLTVVKKIEKKKHIRQKYLALCGWNWKEKKNWLAFANFSIVMIGIWNDQNWPMFVDCYKEIFDPNASWIWIEAICHHSLTFP